jgi:hypothetical protein
MDSINRLHRVLVRIQIVWRSTDADGGPASKAVFPLKPHFYAMAPNVNDSYHMKHDGSPLSTFPSLSYPRKDAKKRRPKDRSVDVFYGDIDGFIGVANNKGNVVAFEENIYRGGVPPFKQSRVPGNFPSLFEIVHPIQISRRTTQDS